MDRVHELRRAPNVSGGGRLGRRPRSELRQPLAGETERWRHSLRGSEEDVWVPRGHVDSEPLSRGLDPEVGRRNRPASARPPALGRSRSTPNVQKSRQRKWHLQARQNAWQAGTYWPMADFSETGLGNPDINLWARLGCLAKYDELCAKRGLQTKARNHELKPALTFLADPKADSGYFLPRPTIEEADAERTTGVDFTETGHLSPHVRRDLLATPERFGQNEKTDGAMDVSWWGSCDAVALAGMIFEKPQHVVTLEGIRFTPRDIMGLLAVIADSQAGGTEMVGHRYNGEPDEVHLRSGRVLYGQIENMSLDDFRRRDFERDASTGFIVTSAEKIVKLRTEAGRLLRLPAAQIDCIAREDPENPSAALFHQTVKHWLRDERPFAMDHDPGTHVWNECFDGANIRKTRRVPGDIRPSRLKGSNGPYGGADLTFYVCEIMREGKVEKRYRYWIEKSFRGDVNSGWLGASWADPNPNFMWRPKSSTPSFSGRNSRNPEVDPAIVKELYLRSLSPM